MKKFLLSLLAIAGMAHAADTTTTRLGLVKPEESSPSWGPKVRRNYDIIDSSVAIYPISLSSQAVGQLPSDLMVSSTVFTTKQNIFTNTNNFLAITLTSGSVNGPFNISGLTANQCVQTSANGLLTTSGAQCGGTGGAAALGAGMGGTAGYSTRTSSPTSDIMVDSRTMTATLTAGSTTLFTLKPSSVTLHGESVILLQSTLQSAATFYVSSGTVAGQVTANKVVASTLAVSGNATIDTLRVTGAGGLTVDNLAAGQCVQTGTGGLLDVTGSACGSGGGGSGSGIVSPGTFTWQNTKGITVSTFVATSTSTLDYVTQTSWTFTGVGYYQSTNAPVLKFSRTRFASFLGETAGNANTTGIFNSALGYASLNLNTTGQYNTAGGADSMLFCGGNANTAYGTGSLFCAPGLSASKVFGSSNTAIGFGAGGWDFATSSAVTTGNLNTYVGYNAGPGAAAQLSNAGCIGAGCKALTSNTFRIGATGVDAVTVDLSSMTASSGTFSGQLAVNSIKYRDGTVQTSSPTAGGGSVPDPLTIGTINVDNLNLTNSGTAIYEAGTLSLFDAGGFVQMDAPMTQSLLSINGDIEQQTGALYLDDYLPEVLLKTTDVGLGRIRIDAYDLFGDSPTARGRWNFTSPNPSTFTALTVSGLTASRCVETTTGGRLTVAAGACGSGSGGSGIVSPSTFTWTIPSPFGLSVNTMTVTSTATIQSLTLGTSIYASYDSSGTITPDGRLGNQIDIVLHSSATINIPINAVDFQKFTYRIAQDGVARSIFLGSGFDFSNSISTTPFSSAGSLVDYLGCTYRASAAKCDINAWDGGH